MASKYVDTTAIMQVIGTVFNNPQILDYTDKYTKAPRRQSRGKYNGGMQKSFPLQQYGIQAQNHQGR